MGFFRVALPGLPTLTTKDLPTFLTPTPTNDPVAKVLGRFILSTMEKLSTASQVVLESFQELESTTLTATASLLRPRLYPVGPLTNHLVRMAAPTTIRGDLWTAQDSLCIAWLNRCLPASVLYVSLGSVVALEPEQVAEMAEGLNDSGRRFLWVLKPAPLTEDTWLPAGFETNIAGRGLVVRWSPQERCCPTPPSPDS